MKKIFGAVLVLMFMFSFSLVSAATIVNGVAYQGEITNPVENADIVVSCAHVTSSGTVINTQNTTSDSNGWYGVSFSESSTEGCNDGDEVTVYATTIDGLYGESGPAVVIDNMIGSLDVAIVNVPMVPEFGFVFGMLTILSAVGIFFVVRKD
ncbi:MAG: hypothetical protein U9Q73_03320 [Nanoarchaeota archaeon]|nr:hypothetical protein [Nanoarchaeota archaeon]